MTCRPSCGVRSRRLSRATLPTWRTCQKQLTDATTNRETAFKGETLHGLLLTSFGFSEFGDKASQAAVVAYLGAGLLILSIFGLLRAYLTPRTKAFAPPDQVPAVDRPRVTAYSRPHLHVGSRTSGDPTFVVEEALGD